MLTDLQVANIIFNETRSLSGAQIMRARMNIAHVIFNNVQRGELEQMAWKGARVPSAEQEIYAQCTLAVSFAREERDAGDDPTHGATHFNFRKNTWRGMFFGAILRTQVGPLDNSYPTAELPAQGIYANTYGGTELA